MQTELAMWWLTAAYAQKLGSPRFRRKLANLACAIIPDKNLPRLRDIVNTMDYYTREIFRKRTQELDGATDSASTKSDEGTKNMLSVLREFAPIMMISSH